MPRCLIEETKEGEHTVSQNLLFCPKKYSLAFYIFGLPQNVGFLIFVVLFFVTLIKNFSMRECNLGHFQNSFNVQILKSCLIYEYLFEIKLKLIDANP